MEVNVQSKIKQLIEKCKKIKGFEIICALVIACIAICIYFSVSNTKASPTQTNSSNIQDQTSLNVKEILSKIQGVGECDVLLTYKQNNGDENDTQQIQGVVVVAQGADDVLVRIQIVNAVCTLLDIEADNIQIFKKN